MSSLLLLGLSGGAAAGAGRQELRWPGLERAREALESAELLPEHDALVVALQRYRDTYAATGTLPLVDQAFRAPLTAPDAVAASTDRMLDADEGRRPPLPTLARELAALGGVALEGEAPDLLAGDPEFEELVARVEAALVRASDAVQAALAELSFAERDALRQGLFALADAFRTSVYVHDEPAHVETTRTAARVDRARLAAAALELAPLADPRLGEALADAWRDARPERPGDATLERLGEVHGRLVYARETPVGWFLIGAAGDNVYDLPLAFLLELGGDDRYEPRATRADLEQPVTVVVDLAGRDTYGAAEPDGEPSGASTSPSTAPGAGAGVLGAALVADHDGDDTFGGRRLSQGVGLCGVGILLDGEGEDTYAGRAYCQGAGLFGFGLLLDREGDDGYDAHVYSQGFGGPLGVGALVDVEGDDRYRATGGIPSSYGTEGEYMAGSQGAGFGFRSLRGDPQAAGGIGVLAEGEGDDAFEVGEFGFGCGYFLGAGLVRDRAGDDVVRARRYGIATGAHLGLGVVLDDAGDDRREDPITACLAGNWDLTLSFLCDAAGRDTYVGAGITLGGATITSLSLFVDADGRDEYRAAGGHSFGQAGHATDVARGTRSLGLFLDLGGDADAYPGAVVETGLPANDRFERWSREDVHAETTAESGTGVFLDE